MDYRTKRELLKLEGRVEHLETLNGMDNWTNMEGKIRDQVTRVYIQAKLFVEAFENFELRKKKSMD